MVDNRSPEAGVDIDRLSLSRRELLVGAGGVLLAGGLAACGSSGSSSSAASGGGSTPAGTPKKGGNFRLAVTGGGSGDIIDGQSIITKPDQARLAASWETLVSYDDQYKLQIGGDNGGLAEELTQDAPTQWTIRLRKGIEFNNGKTLTGDDVKYSIQRILDPKEGLFGAAGLSSIDPNKITVMDPQTVRLGLTAPDSTIAEQFGQYYNGMVPVGYSRKGPLKWVGTGPFKTTSFNPGQQSVHVRNPNYWRTGQPYFDQVTVIDFPSATAQVNALLSGQVDAMTDIPFAQIQVAKSNGGLAILITQGGGWLPLCMAIDMAPFTDNRVRQAMRLIVDRKAMLEQVLSGYGRIANDLFSPFDACYNTDLPQREQDIDKAKSLLKQAGQDGATFDLHTTNGAAGMVDSANIFGAQAKDAGITVNVHNDPNYYGNQYLKLAFSVDFWGTRNYLPQVSNSMLPAGPPYKAPYNETHWPPTSGPGSNYIDLYKQARSEVDPSKRCDIIHEMQSLEYNYGGYIIPFFNNLVDSYSSKVSGFVPGKSTQNLDSFGHGYRTIWFNS
jgi:peptide/nickel transport system substrate-binding protein